MWSAAILLSMTLAVSLSAGETITQTTSFDDNLDVLDNTYNVAEKLRFLHAVWGEIQHVQPLDMKRAQKLHEAINDELRQKMNKQEISIRQQQDIDEFYEEVRQVIVDKSGRQLAQVMNSDNITNLNLAFCQQLILSFTYDPITSRKIYERAIDHIYGTKKPSELAAYLHSIDMRHYESFTLVMDAELYLFWKFIERGDIDDEYLLLIGSYMQQFKNHSQFTLTATADRRLEKAIAQLPTTVWHLFFTRNVCLLNAGYSEYVYEPLDILVDKNRSYVFTWREPRRVGSNGVWNFELIESNWNGSVVLTTRLFNWLKKHYLYRDRSKIVMWVSASEVPANSTWSISLNDNRIILSQDDNLLCAVESVYNGRRRHVESLQNSTTFVPACQWYIDDCPTVSFA